MQCFPIYSVLLALGNPTIDLLSLDVEGPEFEILKSIPWDKVNIRVMLIEVVHLGKLFPGSEAELNEFLDEKGYRFYASLGYDNIYVKKDFPIP